ncbi:MAG: hypothetical protein LM590_11215, partial [Thermofilum sp.]|nr:hypothetical protein [Thermofilum sp.]
VGQCGEPRGSGVSGARAVRVWRCDVVRLLPSIEQEELLRRIGDQCARLVNMENFRRRQLFFSAGEDRLQLEERLETAQDRLRRHLQVAGQCELPRGLPADRGRVA